METPSTPEDVVTLHDKHHLHTLIVSTQQGAPTVSLKNTFGHPIGINRIVLEGQTGRKAHKNSPLLYQRQAKQIVDYVTKRQCTFYVSSHKGSNSADVFIGNIGLIGGSMHSHDVACEKLFLNMFVNISLMVGFRLLVYLFSNITSGLRLTEAKKELRIAVIQGCTITALQFPSSFEGKLVMEACVRQVVHMLNKTHITWHALGQEMAASASAQILSLRLKNRLSSQLDNNLSHPLLDILFESNHAHATHIILILTKLRGFTLGAFEWAVHAYIWLYTQQLFSVDLNPPNVVLRNALLGGTVGMHISNQAIQLWMKDPYKYNLLDLPDTLVVDIPVK